MQYSFTSMRIKVYQGPHFSPSPPPTSLCDDYSDNPRVALPVYSDKPAMVSPAFPKPTMKMAPTSANFHRADRDSASAPAAE